MTSTGARIALLAIVLVGAGTRIGWMLHVEAARPGVLREPDTGTYVWPARAIAETGAFDSRPGSSEPEYLRTPGYPALLASVLVIDDSVAAMLIAQIVVSCATVALAFWVAARLWGTAAGLAAAALLVLDPLQFVFSGKLLTETLEAAVLLAVVALGYRVLGPRGTWPWALALGVAASFATLVRPSMYYLPLVVVAFLVVRAVRAREPRLLVSVAAFLVPVVVLVGGWQVRNAEEVDAWRLSGIEAFNLYYYRAAGALAQSEGVSLGAAQRRIARLLQREHPGVFVCRRDGSCRPDRAPVGHGFDTMHATGFEIALDHPWEVLADAGRGFVRETFNPGVKMTAEYLGIERSRAFEALLFAWLLAFYGLAVLGATTALRNERARRPAHLFALATVAYVLVISAGPEASSRFRVPILGVLALFAGFGASRLTRYVRRSIRPSGS